MQKYCIIQKLSDYEFIFNLRHIIDEISRLCETVFIKIKRLFNAATNF